MATTTRKTTKAKTKTTKPKTTAKKASSSAKTAPAKSTKSTVSKRNRLKQFKQPKAVNLLSLARIHKVTIAVLIVLAVAAGALMTNTSYQLGIGHLAEYKPVEGDTTLLPAVRAVYDVQLRWVVVGILALSAVMPVLYLSKLRAKYEKSVKETRTQPFRWIDLAVTAALMTEVIALLSGVQDLFVLKAVAGLVAITYVLGWVAERQNDKQGKPIWGAFVTGVASTIVAWKLIAAYAIATVVFGTAASPWYVYALYGVGVASFAAFSVAQWRQYRRVGRWADYLVAERNYLVLSLLSKAAFALILIAALR